jgi:hypothetical protein
MMVEAAIPVLAAKQTGHTKQNRTDISVGERESYFVAAVYCRTHSLFIGLGFARQAPSPTALLPSVVTVHSPSLLTSYNGSLAAMQGLFGKEPQGLL